MKSQLLTRLFSHRVQAAIHHLCSCSDLIRLRFPVSCNRSEVVHIAAPSDQPRTTDITSGHRIFTENQDEPGDESRITMASTLAELFEKFSHILSPQEIALPEQERLQVFRRKLEALAAVKRRQGAVNANAGGAAQSAGGGTGAGPSNVGGVQEW